jgi:hypothetical protein
MGCGIPSEIWISVTLSLSEILQPYAKHRLFTSLWRLYVEDVTNKHWILGSNGNNENWGRELSMASWIDSVTVSHPVRYNRLHVAIRSLLMTSLPTLSIGVSMRKDYGPWGKIDPTVRVRSRHLRPVTTDYWQHIWSMICWLLIHC